MIIDINTLILAILLLTCTSIIVWQLWALRKTQEKINSEQKLFLYEKLGELDSKIVENAKHSTAQIEKNSELFVKISHAQQSTKEEMIKHLYVISKEISTSLSEALKEQRTQSSKDIEKLSFKVEERLMDINEKVEKRLSKGFENIDKTFKDIIVGIAKIGEAQKKIEQLSGDVNDLQNVLTDKKSRGVFGEVQLNAILKSIFGEKRDLYDLQYTFANGVMADAVIKAPDPLGIIAVDSKFPMENYTRMVEDAKFASQFKQNIKKHINDIASKYIIQGVTADMAILFLPAEAIFAEINAYHEELIEYGRNKGVWIASPTTIMALLTTITAIIRDIKTQEQAKKIQEELKKLSVNFKRYRQRWENLSKHMDTVNKDVKDITTTTNKIASEFERIEKVEFEDEDDLIEKLS